MDNEPNAKLSGNLKSELKDKLKSKLKTFRKIVFYSLFFILGAMLISLIYGLIIHRSFTLQYIFPGTFLVGSIIVIIGILIALLPIRANFKGVHKDLIDHSNYVSLTMERREKKRELAFSLLFLGFCIIMITALAQWILSFIII